MKRVLIVSYYWPPAGGISVHRCLKFAKYLRNFGWEPIMYVPDGADYIHIDNSNFKHIPDDIEILKGKIWEPFSLFKKLSGRKQDDSSNPVYVRDRKRKKIDELSIWIRGNFFIPDARSMWIKPSVKILSEYLQHNPVDAILSDGPPHTNTVIACELSKKFNIPWLADFQDPWTQVDYYPMLKIGKRADRIHRNLEQDTFKTAKKITIASPNWASELEKIGAENVDPIFWGYDEDDFPEEKIELDKSFSFIHAGMLGFDRFPKTFLKVLSDLCNNIPQFKNDLVIRLAGHVDYAIEKEIDGLGLSDNYHALGKIDFPKAIEYTLQSQILFLPLNIADNAKGRIPGKLFENLRANRPILCLGPKGSDVENIIREVGAGKSFEYDDEIGIRDYILEKYNLYIEDKNIIISNNYEKYFVKNQVKQVANYLDNIIL